MWLYLVRHGEAKHPVEDPERGLTDRGRMDAKWIARRLAQAGVEVNEVRHSGKLRAEQTAEILAAAVAPGAPVEAVGGLKPNDDPHLVAADLAVEPDSIMLVGHLPFMGRLLSLLVSGSPDRVSVEFSTATVAAVRRTAMSWQLAWLINPGLSGE